MDLFRTAGYIFKTLLISFVSAFDSCNFAYRFFSFNETLQTNTQSDFVTKLTGS